MQEINKMLDRAVDWEPIGQVPSDDSMPYATHRGVLAVGDLQLRCYILNTGERIIDAEDFERLLGGLGYLVE